ncbi:MAG: GspE/PulE family protein [bacterium JZ-2024 1]
MKRLGDLLLEWGILTREELIEALREQMRTGKLLGEIVLEMGLAKQEDIERALSETGGMPYIPLDSVIVDTRLMKTFPIPFLRTQLILPLWQTPSSVSVATQTPRDVVLRDRIHHMTQKSPVLYYAPQEKILELLNLLLPQSQEPSPIAQWGVQREQKQEKKHLKAFSLLHELLSTCLNEKATDLYLEPSSYFARVRMRITGKISESNFLPLEQYEDLRHTLRYFFKISTEEPFLESVVSARYLDEEYQLRATALNTLNGESWHIELSEKSAFPFRLDHLELREDALTLIQDSLKLPGVILLAGQPISALIYSLYTLTLEATTPEQKVITVEKPVEVHFPHITQISIPGNRELLTALHFSLSQKPDLLMVSEVRSREEILEILRACGRGVKVIAGFIANSVLDTILQVQALGIPLISLIGAVHLILAQKIVRRICPHCKELVEVSRDYGDLMGTGDSPLWLFRGKGCEICNFSGYRGQVIISEILPFSPEVKSFFLKNPSLEEIRKELRKFLLYSFLDDGKAKVFAGITTLEEIMRVMQ